MTTDIEITEETWAGRKTDLVTHAGTDACDSYMGFGKDEVDG